MSLLAMVKQANRPGPPEHSVVFRAAATGAVVVAIAACWSQSELSTAVAAVSIALVVGGNVLSYRRRASPVRFLKLVLALAVVVAFGWFFVTVYATASAGDLTSVEGPLAVLFTLIQVTHAFDVPSRRDLGFSLAGSATLMAVAAAQAVDNTYGLYVVVWAALGLTGLLAMWSSMVGGSRLRPGTVALAVVGVLAVGLAVVAALPAPHADHSLVLPSVIANDLPVDDAAALVGGGANGTEPVHAGTPGGLTRVGGFLGFAGPLDTAIRATLGTQVVFRVRADRPTFWIAETFDQWTGQTWDGGATAQGRPRLAGDQLGLAVHRAAAGGPGRGAGGLPRLPDLLPQRGRAQPGVPRGQRRRGLVPGPPDVRRALRDNPLGDLHGPGVDLHRPVERGHRHAGGTGERRHGHTGGTAPDREVHPRPHGHAGPAVPVPAAAPSLPPGGRPGRAASPPTSTPPTARWSPWRAGSAPTPSTRPTSPRWPPARTR